MSQRKVGGLYKLEKGVDYLLEPPERNAALPIP